MPLTATKRAADAAQRKVRQACQEIRTNWTNRERHHRQSAAEAMQDRLAIALGLCPEPVKIRVPR